MKANFLPLFSAFARIIESDPTHIQARHNYCVVMLQEGRLVDAERCMNEVFILAPDQKYVAGMLTVTVLTSKHPIIAIANYRLCR